MNNTTKHDERIAALTFASVYPHYITKVEKKGRTQEELHQVIEWLTGYNQKKIQEMIDRSCEIKYPSIFLPSTLI